MPRVKRGTIHTKRRRKILRQTRGFFHQRKSHLRQARQALLKAGQYAYRDRRKKKTVFRALWHVQLNAAVRTHQLSYSAFMHALHQRKILVNRKVLAELAQQHQAVFRRIVETAQEALRNT